MADAKSLDTNGYHTQFVLFTPHDFRGVGADVDSLEIVRFTMPSACGRAPRAAPRNDAPSARPPALTHARTQTHPQTQSRSGTAQRKKKSAVDGFVGGGGGGIKKYFGFHV